MIELVDPPGLIGTKKMGYSHAAVAAGLIFVSGEVALDSSGAVVGNGALHN